MSILSSVSWSFIAIVFCDTLALMGLSDQKPQTATWFSVAGTCDDAVARELVAQLERWKHDGLMPPNEPERVAAVSTAIAKGDFTTSSERLELLRNLCHIYSAGIRAEKITSHRKIIGPCIVAVKRVLFRAVSALLGPTFARQRDFNAGVIRLLGDLCNDAERK